MFRAYHQLRLRSVQAFSTTSRFAKRSRTRIIDESTLAGAQHRPSLSGPSLGHLISELSATRPGMAGFRQEEQTLLEEHRTYARHTAQWIVGLPLVLGTLVVGFNWFRPDKERYG